ncbi:MAG TPA: hypothetical protein G4O04_04150 [Anaerolineae bacterium]|nr:hypothetical protein [Anaerolineae bacterium]
MTDIQGAGQHRGGHPDRRGAVSRLVTHLEAQRVRLLDMRVRQPNLEDVFLRLTGRPLRE